MIKEQLENRKLLVSELRSGKYTQGFGYFVDEEGNYCVMGVAAKVSGLRRIESFDIKDCDGKSISLYQVGKHFGLDSEAVNYLVELNDGGAYPFEYLANVIENELYRI